MPRLSQPSDRYVLWLAGLISLFIGLCFILQDQTMPDNMYWMLDCCTIQRKQLFSVILLTVGILFVCSAMSFLFQSKKTKKFITKLILYRTDSYESNRIEAFQQKYSVHIQVVDFPQPFAFTNRELVNFNQLLIIFDLL
ncbi:hypothetical protein M4D55_07475 [Metabacillus idriensis]|uniref:hypothetical protein n=1 Tax=Metabacillus idriensis TaxID=324768 RepID=UPI00203E389A|nr:hypothetical protein [Metabacillus idriensis]MCM3595621.1 hypothetical protein [Metabacillus idriensis]